MIGVNLIPVARRELSERRARVMLWAGVLVGYTVLLGGAGLAASSIIGDEPDGLGDLQSAKNRLALREQQLKAAGAEAIGFERRLVASRLIAEHPDWSIVSRLIAERRGEGVMLDSLAIAPDRSEVRSGKRRVEYIVRIDGAGVSQRTVNDYVKTLEELGLFASVRQVESRVRTIESTQMVGFQLECRVGSEPVKEGAK